jgi:hypothetical protein
MGLIRLAHEPVPGRSLRAGSIHEQGMLIDHKHPAATTKPTETRPGSQIM